MIPEQAREEILRLRKAGQTWTGITERLKERFGLKVHRTTVQRCHDKWAFSDKFSFEVDEQVELDKKSQNETDNEYIVQLNLSLIHI